MSKCVLLVMVSILGATVPPVRVVAQADDKAAAERVLIDSERKINDAVVKGDKSRFLALVAKDGLWVSGGGFVPVTLFVDALDQIELTRSDIVNPQVLWVNPTTAVVVYAWTGTGSIMDQPFKPKVASTVWTKRGDKWVAVYHQESEAPSQ